MRSSNRSILTKVVFDSLLLRETLTGLLAHAIIGYVHVTLHVSHQGETPTEWGLRVGVHSRTDT